MNSLNKNMRRIKKIHMIGIGGTGMGGIAEVLMNLGYEVSGSDKSSNSLTQHLIKLGVKISQVHSEQNVENKDVVVVSAAIDPTNPEILRARELRIPIVPRAAMLAELMRFKEGIGVAGTHGKTTTTSLIASLLAEGGEDPTFVIGGKLNSLGSNARLGKGRYFVAEACESDASFLQLTPLIAVLTNIDRDHLETYENDFLKLKQTYIEFLHRLPFYGLAILCIDDLEILSILEKVERPILSYGFCENADYQILSFKQIEHQSQFKLLCKPQKQTIEIILNLPGKHNVLNAVAATICALEAGIDFLAIQKALLNFEGINRRFNLSGPYNKIKQNILLVDDYGHHPREVEVVIDAIRQGWSLRRLVLIFQPHRFSRTKALYEDFVNVLNNVDVLLLLDIYAAGEQAIPGIDSRTLCGSIRSRNKIDPIFIDNKNNLFEVLNDILMDGDIVLMQGAGDIGLKALEFKEYLKF
ncbi:MAG: UDP-N-acetylmuramate--L-alanine ligase [Francisellaceae bacterium]|nr:UDP-N-acetylmuramate--L-alanine ligase [Francisellaceae bacterium]